MLKYVCRVSWGMEVNTALMMYKSYIRSIMDYALFIYFPRDCVSRIQLERLQYKGIRTALGYRNSTPTNVMISEANVLNMEDRAGLLARNHWIKIISYDDKDMIASMNRLSQD